jgi:protein-tyrosine phosphatase
METNMKVHVKWTPGATWRSARTLDTRVEARQGPAEFPPPPGLIDIHSHILWDLDDGSQNLEQSLAMLQMAADNGTTDIVATPHANYRYKFDPEAIAYRIKALQTRSPSSLRIHSGCDFHLNVNNIRDALANPHRYTINGLNYLMVEFPEIVLPASSEDILRRLIAHGINPVITHPERNSHLRQDLDRLAAWVAMGCLIQVTAQALTDRFGKDAQKSAWALVKKDLVHAVASDAHDTVDRPPRLDHAWRLLKQEMSEEVAARLLINNPRAVIEGKPLPGVNLSRAGESAKSRAG